jgi:uncharacterized RDD family membrane protein YckC
VTTPSDPNAPTGAPAPVAWQAPKEELAGPAPGVRFAGHGGRLIAYIVDGFIVGCIYLLLFLVFGSVLFAGFAGSVDFSSDFGNGQFSGRVPTAGMFAAFAGFFLLFFLALIVAFAYFPFFWARSGQTPGMRLFGLYVVRDADGGKISGGQAVLRLIGMWISAIPLYLGFAWILIDARRRGWHDLIAGTVVVERGT